MVVAYQKLVPLLGRFVQHPTVQSLLLVAVAAVGLLMDSNLVKLNTHITGLNVSVGELDERVAAQTEIVTQLKIDLQVLKATGQAESARVGERIGAIEQRISAIEARQRERDAVFDAAAVEHRRAMDSWERTLPRR